MRQWPTLCVFIVFYLDQCLNKCFDFILFLLCLGLFFFFFGCPGSSLLHGSFSSFGERALLVIVVHWLLVEVASLVAEQRL